jgi:O-ureido-D-serine cyclo-ligase
VTASTNAKRIALVSSQEAQHIDEDMPPLLAACTALGVEADVVCWDDPTYDWRQCDVALLRSPWDYVPRYAEFTQWAERVAQITRLINPLSVVQWNTDKHYLLDLARARVAVVPTRFAEPHEQAGQVLTDFLDRGDLSVGAAEPFDEYVIKPSIGAGSKDALRLHRSEAERAHAHLTRLLAAGRSAMLQPYLSRVDEHGETAVIYVDGRVSHAIRKGALLKPQAGLVTALFAAEDIRARAPSKDEGRVAKAAFNAIPFETPLYARVDLIHDGRGQPVVLELELTEPSLFFTHAEGSAARFVEALLARLG